jgi:hypothetical protein
MYDETDMHVAHTWEMRNIHDALVLKPEMELYLEYQRVHEMTILICILWKLMSEFGLDSFD